jgi:hypothetical protein
LSALLSLSAGFYIGIFLQSLYARHLSKSVKLNHNSINLFSFVPVSKLSSIYISHHFIGFFHYRGKKLKHPAQAA